MKKGKWAALAVAVAALSSVAIACDNGGGTNQEHQHTYGEWVITTEPTETTGGVATRYCTGDDKTPDTFDLPKLTDTSVWTVDAENSVDAGHGIEGKIVYTSDYGDVEIIVPAEAHAYGAWKLTKEPTLTEKGKATRECAADGKKDTVEVAKLSDTSVWTKDAEKSEAPTHFKAGKDVYKSVYGEVAVALDSIPHAYGDWTMTKEPTLTEAGEAERVCADDNEKDIVEVAKLSDTNVWTKEEFDADYNAGGRTEYTSMFGKIVFEDENAPKLVAPYDGKTYYGIPFLINSNRLNGQLEFETTWLAQHVALDENATGVPTNGSLFGSIGKDFRILMRDYDKGLISLNELDEAGKITKSTTAYLDVESGIFVFPRTSFSTVNTEPVIATPFDTDANLTQSKVKASAWTVGSFTALSVSYTTHDGDTHNIFIYDNAVYFGVDFKTSKDASGTAIDGGACYNAKHLYVMRGDDQIFAFAYTGTEMVVADGYEGSYTGKLDADASDVELVVSGYGVFEGISGSKYEIAAKGESYTLGAYIDGSYYELTLGDDGTFTSVKPMVTITIVSDYGDFDVKTSQFNKNIEVPLPTDLTDENMFFGGWFTDASLKTPVKLTASGGYIPTADATLYAKWTRKLIVTTVIDEVEYPIECGEGDELGSKLPIMGIDEEKNRYFVGWFMNEECTIAAPLNAALDESVKLYAKFETLPDYYGERTGKQMLSSSAYVKRAEITIDEHGKISGSIFTGDNENERAVTGTVRGYDKATGRITYTTDGTDARYMWLDAETGLLTIPADLTNTEMDTFPFVLGKAGSEIGDNFAFDYHNGSSETAKTKLIAYGADKLALICNDRIYGNVSVTGVLGTEDYNVDNVKNAKSIVVKNSKGEIIIALGTTAENFSLSKDNMGKSDVVKALDAVYGEYTGESGTIVLDGVGGLIGDILNEKSVAANLKENQKMYASYAPVTDGDGYDVYFYIVTVTESEDDDNYGTTTKTYTKTLDEYYKLTLGSGKAYTLEKIMVQLTYDVNLPQDATGIDDISAASDMINANIAFNLTKELNDAANYAFDGWLDSATGEKVDKVTFAQNGVVYAKWIAMRTVSFNANFTDASEIASKKVGNGRTVELPESPIHPDGLALIGWFTKNGEEWDAEYTAETPITADIQLYAKWADPVVFAGTFVGKELYGATSQTGSMTFVVDASGLLTDATTQSNLKGSRATDYNIETQLITLNKGNSTYYLWYEPTLNLLVSRYSSHSTKTMGGDIYFTVKDGEIVDHIGIMYKLDGNGNFSTGTGYSASETRFVAVKKGEITSIVLIFNNRFYTQFTATDVSGNNLVSIADIKNAQSIIVKVDNEILFAAASDKKFSEGQKCKLLDEYYGEYTVPEQTDKIVLDGVGGITYGSKSGTYEKAVDGDDYTFDVYLASKSEYWQLTVDPSDKTTCTFVKPMVTISFVTEHGAVESMPVNKNIKVSTLPTLTAEGFYFVGWYETDKTVVVTELTPTENITLTAYWVVPHALMGVYKGGESYGSNNAIYDKNITIDALGNITGSYTLSIVSYDENTGILLLKNSSNSTRYAFYDSASKTIAFASGSYDNLTSTVFIGTLVSDNSVKVTSSMIVKWDNRASVIAKLTVGETEKLVFVYNNKVYGDVAVTVVNSAGETVIDTKNYASVGNIMTITDKPNSVIYKFGYFNNNFVLADGSEGTYTGSIGNIVSDGYGHFTVGSETVEYTRVEDKFVFVAANTLHIVQLSDGIYTKLQDGYSGTYTLPEGGTIVLDGLGGAGNGKTYVVNGKSITIYDGQSSVQYGIDVDNKVFLSKSIVAGLVFSGTYYDNNWESNTALTLTFDDTTTISGTLMLGTNYGFIFVGELSGDIITCTITDKTNYGDAKHIGKTFTLKVENGKLTFTSSIPGLDGVSSNDLKNCVVKNDSFVF